MLRRKKEQGTKGVRHPIDELIEETEGSFQPYVMGYPDSIGEHLLHRKKNLWDVCAIYFTAGDLESYSRRIRVGGETKAVEFGKTVRIVKRCVLTGCECGKGNLTQIIVLAQIKDDETIEWKNISGEVHEEIKSDCGYEDCRFCVNAQAHEKAFLNEMREAGFDRTQSPFTKSGLSEQRFTKDKPKKDIFENLTMQESVQEIYNEMKSLRKDIDRLTKAVIKEKQVEQ